jgi:DNA ligase-1
MMTCDEEITTFNKLFKEKNQWEIKIEKKDDIYIIITTHGKIDGKLISHNTEITKGKAKKTILEQATQEAHKKWLNKKEKELYSENVGTILEMTDIKVRPMLANTFSFDIYKTKNRSYKPTFPVAIQKKYDGIRCISYMKNDEVIIESRKGIPFQNFKLLKEELKKLFKKLPDNFYFDGELYTDKLDFEIISGLIRLHEKKCSIEDIELINMINYHIYDFVDVNNLTQIYKERHLYLNDFFKNNKTSKCINVNTIIIDELSDIKKYHDDFVKDGFEGIMIRDMNGVYEINKRSKYLQKFKEFMEEEFKIVGFHEGSGDEKGSVIWECITKDEKTFSVRPKGTFEFRKKLFELGDQNIGKLLTVIFQEYSSDNIPRFPVGKGIRDIY